MLSLILINLSVNCDMQNAIHPVELMFKYTGTEATFNKLTSKSIFYHLKHRYKQVLLF